MFTCIGLKKTGERCAATVDPPQTYCWWHDPANADQRSRAASKAAKSKGSTELGDVKRQLRDIADAVLEGSLDKGRGSIAAQVLGVFTRVVEVERKIREQDELIERFEELEAALERQNRARGYGA